TRCLSDWSSDVCSSDLWILKDSDSAVLVCRAADALLIQPYLPANVRMLLALGSPEIQLAQSSSGLSVVQWKAMSKFDEQGYSDEIGRASCRGRVELC